MKNKTAQIQMGHISMTSQIILFLMMMLFAKGSMAQSGETWVDNTGNLYRQTGGNSPILKSAESYLWVMPTEVSILSGQGINAITERTGTVTPLVGAPSYTWTFGSENSIISGQDTVSLIVNPGEDSGQIKCTKNSCGSSAATTLAGKKAINQ